MDDMDTDEKSSADGEQLDLPARAEALKEQGNEHFRKGSYDAAIDLYSKAIGETLLPLKLTYSANSFTRQR